MGDLGHVIGPAELFLCQQIGGKGDSLAQAHPARGGEEGMGVEMRKSTSFISFPSLGVKQSSMAVSSPKPEPSGRFDSAPGAATERRGERGLACPCQPWSELGMGIKVTDNVARGPPAQLRGTCSFRNGQGHGELAPRRAWGLPPRETCCREAFCVGPEASG